MLGIVLVFLCSMQNSFGEVWPARRQRIANLNAKTWKTKLTTKNATSINLFEDYNWIIVKESITTSNTIGPIQIWYGSIVGDSESIVVFAYNEKKNRMAGQILAQNKTITIRPVNDNEHLIIEQDAQDKLDNYNDAIKVGVKQNKESLTMTAASAASDTSSGYVIDLLVAYTDDVAANSSDVDLEIAADIALVNKIYARSCTNIQFRLVGTEQVFYNEGGISSEDLRVLATNNDGILDQVITTRNAIGADLVMLWVENSNLCGLGYAPTNPNNAAFGFSLRLHACNAITSAHEIGHNMGLIHDRYQQKIAFGDTNAPYEDGYGHVNLNTKIYTVMSYPSQCNDLGLQCTSIPYFSNPHIFYKNHPLGFFQTQNETRKISATAGQVAAYRSAITPANYNPSVSCEANSAENKKKFCFIATVGLGSADHPIAQYFRMIRDNYLMTNSLGRKFVEFYYENAPIIAAELAYSPIGQFFTKVALVAIYILIRFGLAWIGLGLLFFIPLLNVNAQVAVPRLSPQGDWENFSSVTQTVIPNRSIFALDYNTGVGQQTIKDIKLIDRFSMKRPTLSAVISLQEWACIASWVPKETIEEINSYTGVKTNRSVSNNRSAFGIGYRLFSTLYLGVDFQQNELKYQQYPDSNPSNINYGQERKKIYRSALVYNIFGPIYLGYRANILSKSTNHYGHEIGLGSYQKTPWGAYIAYFDYNYSPLSMGPYEQSTERDIQYKEKKYRYGTEIFLENDFFITTILNDFNFGIFFYQSNQYAIDSGAVYKKEKSSAFQIGFLAFSHKGFLGLKREEIVMTDNVLIDSDIRTSIIVAIYL